MIFARPKVNPTPTFRRPFSRRLALSANPFLYYFYSSKFSSSFTVLKCHCTEDKSTDKSTQGFSVLTSDIPWKTGSLWSAMAVYMFNLHIPLGFGGLSIVAYILNQPVLDPQTQSLSLLLLDILELISTLLLLKSTIKPKNGLMNFFKSSELSIERNWVLASALGFGILILFVFLTSILADRLYGVKDVNNPILKEMLLSSDISKVACVIVYCIITPPLEEMVYRGFLLASLVSTMSWQQAVVLSAAIFSAAHFSGENFLQLFVVGCILGCSYCGTGNLRSSIVIHSLYNALTLIITFSS
ncbi:Prenyl-dependent CAAX protease, putative isoform 1 [Theobroma cacao]|uniref:Prenyl-dependent CAAX protease, putative isoform 1 n=1 Tax=Theobroma cacao TaxID=3641 RepID=A0A061E2X7_THECC|nr:Prenyl-dependent CAAX protease, putative isoform 1 [Theobroma cacao]